MASVDRLQVMPPPVARASPHYMAPNGQPRKGFKGPAGGAVIDTEVAQKPKSARSLSFGVAPSLALKTYLPKLHEQESQQDWSIPASEHAAA